MIIGSTGGKALPNHPEGTFVMRCVRIIDLGTQQGEYQGKPKVARKVRLVFESSELMPDDAGDDFAGKPFLVNQTFTASLSEKATLSKFLEAWRGQKFTDAQRKGFDISTLLNAPALCTIVHTVKGDKTYVNIQSAAKLVKGMNAPAATVDRYKFSLEDFDQATFDKLSQYTQQTIAKSPEYQALFPPSGQKPAVTTRQATPAGDDIDDDIPF